MFDLEEEPKKLPASPGVYLIHNDRDEIVYVGKAIGFKSRVRQYFRSSRNKTAKIEQMVSHTVWLEYILTNSELEALVSECNLIKERRLWYNATLEDDKSYPYIKVTVGESFPRLLFARDMEKDGRSRYPGPYTSAGVVKDTLDSMHKLYRIRTCNRNLLKDTGKGRPCLNYHIRQCDVPCQGYIPREEHQSNFNQTLDFLSGRYDPLIKSLQEKMQTASDSLELERAIEYRELLNSVKQAAQKQGITSNGMEGRNIVAMARDERSVVVQVFFIREGKLAGRDYFHISAATMENEGEILDSFVKQFYAGTPFISRKLWLQHPLGGKEVISQWPSAKRGQKVRLVVPKKGEKERLVELVARNATLVLSQDKERIKKEELCTTEAMNRTGGLIGIEGIRRMEAYDIFDTNGVESVGSVVAYEDGRSKRSGYRKFRIKTVRGPNNYASMEEVLTRRFPYGMRETEELKERGADLSLGSFTRFPDLIMMDGGRGRVNIVLEVLGKLGLSTPACGMVKGSNHRTRGLYYSNVEVPIDRHLEGFRLITRIQNEAHCLAIEYHRGLRGKGQVKSIPGDIPGIGPARRKALMRRFKDIEAVRSASVEDLEQTLQMDRRLAESVYRYFHSWPDGTETGAVTNLDDGIEMTFQSLETQ